MIRLGSCLVVDCKSLYDHVIREGAAGTLADKTGALDVVVLKQHLQRLGLPCRWAPTTAQLADCLTKSDADAMDHLRATMRSGRYQLSDEDATMKARAEEKERRLSCTRLLRRHHIPRALACAQGAAQRAGEKHRCRRPLVAPSRSRLLCTRLLCTLRAQCHVYPSRLDAYIELRRALGPER